MKIHRHLTKKWGFVIAATALLPNLSHTQTGPAGVGNSSTNQVWLDAHSLGFSDGASISSWTDLSGNSSNFSQPTSDQQPVYNETGIGGIPSITFDGVNDILTSGSIPALESANVTYFIAYDRTTTTSDILINANYDSDFKKWRTYMNNGQNTIISAQYSPTINWVRYTDPPGASYFSTHITPTQIRTYNEGDLEMTKSATYTVPTGHNSIYLGNRDPLTVSSYTYTGEIGEVIIFNSTLNDLERVLIENYLAVKYNLNAPTDLYDYEASHRFGLIGIGDDGTNTQTIAQGAGILEISGAAEMSSGEYFMVANTDFAPNEYNSLDVPASLPDHQRLERTWRVDETGEVGTTTLTFRLGPLYDFGSTDSYRLLVDTDGTFSDATILTGTYDAGTSSVSFTVDLSDGDYFTLAGIQEILSIHSITDGDWNTPSTWDCTCIPAIVDSVFVEPATTVTIDGSASAGYLSVEEGGLLQMSTEENINLTGDLDVAGNINFTAGNISFIGAVPQTLSVATISPDTVFFHNMLVSNTSGGDVTLSLGKFQFDGTLLMNLGSLVVSGSAEAIIHSSSATEGGRVGAIVSPATISGNFSVQRYIPPGNADWRNLCSPVVGSTFDDWDPDLAMSGPDFPDGCAWGPEDCFRSVTYTDHSIQYDVLSSTEPILNGRGFEIFVGTDLATFSGTTLTSRGPLNAPTDIVKSYTTGWTIVGNPYASPITFRTLPKSSSIGKYYYVYDASSGVYQWYDQTSETSSIPEITSDGLMATGQAVWIFATSAGSITFRQADKTDANALFIRDSEPENEALSIRLEEENSGYSCSFELQEIADATDGADELLDIRHFANGTEKGPGFAIDMADELWRKNYIQNDGKEKTFNLKLELKNDGRYTISAENWANFRHYEKILLIDSKTGNVVDLKQTNYPFSALVDMDDNRFKLRLVKAADGDLNTIISANNENIETPALQVTQMDHVVEIQALEEHEGQATIVLTNILGQEQVFTTQTNLVQGANFIALPEELNGFYILSVRNGTTVVNKKIML